MVSNPALTGFTAPKILWLQQHEPRNYDKCRQILLPKDYIRFRLTGQFASEVSDASGTLMLNVKTRAWHGELLTRLGIDPAPGPETARRCLEQLGLCFMFAPAYHAATKHAAGPRREVGFRTLFNLLGPLTNPAGTRYHVNGVFSRERCEFLARAHGQMGSRRAMVVHGAGGLDEFAPAGPTFVADLCDGKVRCYDISPADFGLAEASPDELKGGEPAKNAHMLLESLRPAWLALPVCLLLLANARLPLLENWTRPLRGPHSLWVETRDEAYFNDMGQWNNRASYLQAVGLTARSGCDSVGLDVSENQLEYPFQALLRQRIPSVRFVHTGVENASARYYPDGPPRPCAVLCLDCIANRKKLELYTPIGEPIAIGRFLLFLAATGR